MRPIAIILLSGLLVACETTTDPASATDVMLDEQLDDAKTASFTGRSTAFDATLSGSNTKLCDTGALPRTGGKTEHTLTNQTLADVLRAATLYCLTTSIGTSRASSEATLSGFELTIGGNTISADRLHSMVGAWCPPLVLAPTTKGHTALRNLKINGRAVAVASDRTNQILELRNGYAVLNDQTSFVSPWHAGRTVIGLRVVINNGQSAEVLLARTQMHIDCP